MMDPDGRLPADVSAVHCSEDDRSRVVEVIKAAFADGRLNAEEYADRVTMALKSRTHSELARVTSDLPAAPPGARSSLRGRPAPSNVSPFDWAAAVTCACSVSLTVFFSRNPFTLFWLAAAGLAIAASVRSRRAGPRWERVAIWSISIVVGITLVDSTLWIFT